MEALDCAASWRDDGSLALFITNIAKDRTYTVQLPENYTMKTWTKVYADSFDAHNAPGHEVVKYQEMSVTDHLQIAPGTVNLILL